LRRGRTGLSRRAYDTRRQRKIDGSFHRAAGLYAHATYHFDTGRPSDAQKTTDLELNYVIKDFKARLSLYCAPVGTVLLDSADLRLPRSLLLANKVMPPSRASRYRLHHVCIASNSSGKTPSFRGKWGVF
jgi:hypothetical protein